jgi:hypothetical protein
VYTQAADGHVELVWPILEVNPVLRDLTDDSCQTSEIYSGEIITGAVRLIRTSQALLKDRIITQTIH